MVELQGSAHDGDFVDEVESTAMDTPGRQQVRQTATQGVTPTTPVTLSANGNILFVFSYFFNM